MAGLMRDEAPGQPEVAPEPAGGPPEASEGHEMASPEEQQLYDEIVSRAYVLIFEGDEKSAKVRGGVLQSLQDEDPKQALASTAAAIFGRVLQAAQEGGVEIPGDVKEAAGAEVFETLAEVASKAGVHDFVNDDQAFQAAFLLAADELRQIETSTGTTTQEQAQGSFQEIAAMDKDGRLDAIMKGIA